MTSYLITGTSRGLGLALTSQLLDAQHDAIVIATARNESPALQKLATTYTNRFHFVKLDVIDAESIKAAVPAVESALNGRGLDTLVNNAGVLNFAENMSDLDSTLQLNVSGPHHVISAFLPLLRKGSAKTIVNITSTLGSFGLARAYTFAPCGAYKVSKAALNMLTVQYAQTLAPEEFICTMLSPGWLQTDLGGRGADLPVEVGAKATLDIILGLKKEDNGRFRNIYVAGWEKTEGPNQYDGEDPPW